MRALVAEHASSHRIQCGGWASLPAESARTSPRYVPPGHVAGPDPPAVCWFYRVGGPDGRGRSRTPMGGPGPRLSASELPYLRDTWRLRTYPKRGTGPGPLAW